ncbi:DNA replication licensing factor MCM5 [Capsicum annuum]|uniref:DNA replication licensing factor MCM5 n=1 Tax=Capsicum annuum TaxID=4072 RepID=UPI0007BFDC40|nr:DNA replication licensing factor MCM5 [Capsicum annuum]KAF3679863.1 DNA replication licensing factor MCM5 [Capsicum annuum]KAF3681900.1 DNA replication licensing factor MCM5 [Capsicum annuum]
MSGWDEGAVYYSDQAQFPHGGGGAAGGGGDGENGGVSRHVILRKFKEFIRNFPDKSQPNVFPYREALVENQNYLVVNLSDLLSYERDQTLPELLRQNPADYLPLFETAAVEVLASLRSRIAGESGEMEEPEIGEVQILLRSEQDSMSMRSLGAQYISKLVKVSGIVIAASRTKAKATYVTLLCKNCKNVKIVPCRPGLGGAIVPRSCDHVPQVGEEPCPIDPWVVVPDKSKYVDQQTLKLQENPEDVPTGELPRNMLLSIDRHLVQTIVPGTRLTIMGIYSIFQASNSSTSHKGAVAVRQPYIRVVGLEETNEANSRGPANFTVDEKEEFMKFASDSNAYDKICAKVAPSIFGHVDVKKAVTCLLFGGSRKFLPDGVRLRGDINVLLLGDPSTAKSQFLKFVEKTAPVAVYTSGKGSSAAGLTASVIRDNSSREFYLEGGAMVLADGGVVCIDEFDKMRPEDRVAIHEAMEQQTISIAKAGITTVLNSRTSVLAAANPPSGRYDDLKTAQDNIDLQTTILSRFDLIFIVKDIRKYDQDKNIASHIIKVHASAEASRDDTRTMKEYNWLKRYIQYCKANCHPRLSDSAASMLQESYVKIRQDMRRQSNETGEATAIPITVRQLEAIVRLSEALARMRLSQVANEDHVKEAIRLFNTSTMDAARSGISQHINVTPEMANEIKQAEVQIKRRMGIGSHISERRLIDDLTRMGMNESIVRRALIIMHQRDEVEYKRERRVILRKA